MENSAGHAGYRTTSLFLALLFVSLLTARGDNLLQNGDFSQGSAHWRGDIKNKQVVITSSAGLTLPLRLNDFVFISQPFICGQKSVAVTVAYQVSPDYAVADWSRAASTMRASKAVGIASSTLARALLLSVDQPFMAPPNAWLVLVVDSNQNGIGYSELVPVTGKTGAQTATVRLDHLMRNENKVLYLFLPPARGSNLRTGFPFSSTLAWTASERNDCVLKKAQTVLFSIPSNFDQRGIPINQMEALH